MDYTNFVRTYYRVAIKNLNKYGTYNGSIVDVDYRLDIPNNEMHIVENNLDILPNFELNINAETKYFENFLEYYGNLYPEVGAILLSKDNLQKLYKDLVVTDDDEAILSAISLYIGGGIECLAKFGILSE